MAVIIKSPKRFAICTPIILHFCSVPDFRKSLGRQEEVGFKFGQGGTGSIPFHRADILLNLLIAPKEAPAENIFCAERILDKAFERALKRRHEPIKGEEAFKILDRVIIQKNGDALFLFRDGRKTTIHARDCKT